MIIIPRTWLYPNSLLRENRVVLGGGQLQGRLLPAPSTRVHGGMHGRTFHCRHTYWSALVYIAYVIYEVLREWSGRYWFIWNNPI